MLRWESGVAKNQSAMSTRVSESTTVDVTFPSPKVGKYLLLELEAFNSRIRMLKQSKLIIKHDHINIKQC